MIHKLFYFMFIIVACYSFSIYAQKLFKGNLSYTYYGKRIDGDIYSFDSDEQAEAVVKKIIKYSGLPQNFTILASNVENAAAAIKDGKRYILYNQTFMKKIETESNTDWAATSILAHEIGHHLSGHTLSSEGSSLEIELEADQFSGHILYMMGATLDQAQTAINIIASESGSKTHPGKSARLAAIANGWTASKELLKKKEPGANNKQDSQPEEKRGKRKQIIIESEDEDIDDDFTGTCYFADGGVFNVNKDGNVSVFYFGMNINIATITYSYDKRFMFYYTTISDPSMETYMNMFGMTATTKYGIDNYGGIWGQNQFGQLFKLGQYNKE